MMWIIGIIVIVFSTAILVEILKYSENEKYRVLIQSISWLVWWNILNSFMDWRAWVQ